MAWFPQEGQEEYDSAGIPHSSFSPASFTLRSMCRFASCLVNLWGLSPEISHFSTAPNLSITDSVGTSLPYRRLASVILQEKARKRSAVASDFFAILADGGFPAEGAVSRGGGACYRPGRKIQDFWRSSYWAGRSLVISSCRARSWTWPRCRFWPPMGPWPISPTLSIPPHGAQGYQANQFQANQFPACH